jgi:copper chaperone CopZ
MAIELNAYGIDCPHCGEEVEFVVNDIEGLAHDIEEEVRDAERSARDEAEREFDGMVDPEDLPIQPRTIHDLAAAIERGDTGEARLLLGRIADDLGLEHKSAAEIGRFSNLARAA